MTINSFIGIENKSSTVVELGRFLIRNARNLIKAIANFILSKITNLF
ncbi:MAG: hypothetical protein AAF630_03890 [Cyanobacteria bacterium P01_C01_bin.38]